MDPTPCGAEPVAEQARLGRRPGAVEPLEDDEAAAPVAPRGHVSGRAPRAPRSATSRAKSASSSRISRRARTSVAHRHEDEHAPRASRRRRRTAAGRSGSSHDAGRHGAPAIPGELHGEADGDERREPEVRAAPDASIERRTSSRAASASCSLRSAAGSFTGVGGRPFGPFLPPSEAGGNRVLDRAERRRQPDSGVRAAGTRSPAACRRGSPP